MQCVDVKMWTSTVKTVQAGQSLQMNIARRGLSKRPSPAPSCGFSINDSFAEARAPKLNLLRILDSNLPVMKCRNLLGKDHLDSRLVQGPPRNQLANVLMPKNLWLVFSRVDPGGVWGDPGARSASEFWFSRGLPAGASQQRPPTFGI